MRGRMRFWRPPFGVCDRIPYMNQAAVKQEILDSEGDYGVIARAAELCNPFLDALGEVTLSVRGPVASSVLNWNASLFRPLIHPLLLDVTAQAAVGGSFEISSLDCLFDAKLPASVRLSSRNGGRRLLQGLLAPRGDRMIERYRASVLSGDSPGHLAVIHALRAFLVHLPPRVTLGAYLRQEGVGAGMDGRDISRFLIGGICGAEEPSASPARLASL